MHSIGTDSTFLELGSQYQMVFFGTLILHDCGMDIADLPFQYLLQSYGSPGIHSWCNTAIRLLQFQQVQSPSQVTND